MQPILKACFLPLIAICLLPGCRQENPRNSKAPLVSQPASAPGERVQTGEALFKQYCSPCHPDGGNVTDPQRSLYGSILKKNHITKPEDVVRIMRNPASRMLRYDAQTISDKDAFAIAEYVLTTFK
ncbi:MAG TPA: cytochrome c [Desulfuromonadaceae bacterium]|jgi:cytochrome c6